MKKGFVVAMVALVACTKTTEKEELKLVDHPPPTVEVISKNQVFREFTASYDAFFGLLQQNDRNRNSAIDVNAELMAIQSAPTENEKWARFGKLFDNIDQIKLAAEKRNKLYDRLNRAFPGLSSLDDNAKSRLIVEGMSTVRARGMAPGSLRYAVLSCDDYKTTIQECQNNRDLQTVACGLACPSIFGCVVCGTTVYFIYRNCVGNANQKWPNCVTTS